MSNMGLTAGSRVTLVTETHVIACTIQSVRLRDPCAPCVAHNEGRYQPCGQDTPVKLVVPSDSGRYQPEPSCTCPPTPQKVAPCADLPCELPYPPPHTGRYQPGEPTPCEPCHEPDPCCTPEPCCEDAEQAKLQAELAEQATKRLNLDEFEVALETGVALKRNG